MIITYEKAHSPVWGNAEKTAIELKVKFHHIEEEVDFTARADDPEVHGRALFAQAVAGEFGEIEDYVPPTELEIAQATNPTERSQQMALCISKVQHWEMMGEFAAAMEWRHYYQALAMLEKTETWPIVEIWPTAPAE